MDYLIVAAVAFGASLLALYSGFGLGTLLLPAFSLFFPVEAAVAATAVVHLLNNLFKAGLLARRADRAIVLRFGLPAIPGALAGAWLLGLLGRSEPLFRWEVWGRGFGPTAAGLAVGLVIIVFALLELQAWFRRLSAPRSLLVPGGLATGFLGGLTGQQGALRSVFLLKSGLAPARFIATGVVIAVLVDLSRLATYAASFAPGSFPAGRDALLLLAAGIVSAIAGAWIGTRHMEKVTIGAIRNLVAGLMLLIGAALCAGLIGA